MVLIKSWWHWHCIYPKLRQLFLVEILSPRETGSFLPLKNHMSMWWASIFQPKLVMYYCLLPRLTPTGKNIVLETIERNLQNYNLQEICGSNLFLTVPMRVTYHQLLCVEKKLLYCFTLASAVIFARKKRDIHVWKATHWGLHIEMHLAMSPLKKFHALLLASSDHHETDWWQAMKCLVVGREGMKI